MTERIPPPASIDAYIEQSPVSVRPILENIRRTIRDAAPEAEELISYRVPAFRWHGILVYFAAFKHHIGLYPPVSGDAPLERALAPYRGPKGNLQFPLDKPIPYDLIRRIVLDKLQQHRARAAARDATPKKGGRGPKGLRGGRVKQEGPSIAQGVKLLAGGNPQIAKGDGDAAVQAYIAAMPGWKQDIGRRLDQLIVRLVPGVRKAVRWNSPFYGIEGQGWFLSFHCMTRYIKVAFFRGASLHPVPPVASKKEAVRYVHLYEHEAVSGDGTLDEAQLASWIRQASELPGDTCF